MATHDGLVCREWSDVQCGSDSGQHDSGSSGGTAAPSSSLRYPCKLILCQFLTRCLALCLQGSWTSDLVPICHMPPGSVCAFVGLQSQCRAYAANLGTSSSLVGLNRLCIPSCPNHQGGNSGAAARQVACLLVHQADLSPNMTMSFWTRSFGAEMLHQPRTHFQVIFTRDVHLQVYCWQEEGVFACKPFQKDGPHSGGACHLWKLLGSV